VINAINVENIENVAVANQLLAVSDEFLAPTYAVAVVDAVENLPFLSQMSSVSSVSVLSVKRLCAGACTSPISIL